MSRLGDVLRRLLLITAEACVVFTPAVVTSMLGVAG